MNKTGSLWLILLLLMMTGLACNFGLAGPKPPPVPISTEAIQNLEQQVSGAVEQLATSGSATIEITESQLTSALAMGAQIKSILTNPQIRLQNGEIQVTGSNPQAGLLGDINVIIKVEAGPDCKLKLQVVSAKVGPLPLSSEMVDQVLPIAEQAISEMTATSGQALCIDSVVINDGKMVITGHTR